MERSPDSLPQKSMHKILIGSILPRPIGWISSLSPDGKPNLAPFSFFNAVCSKPPHILFCPGVRGTDGSWKDTLNNVRATGEFVANIVTEALAEAMNVTSTEFPAGVDEFEAAGLRPAQSVEVKPPRVADSPIHFECRVAQILDLSREVGGASIVVGRVVHLHIDDAVLEGEDRIELSKLRPIGRLAGAGYCRVTDVFEMVRPPPQIK